MKLKPSLILASSLCLGLWGCNPQSAPEQPQADPSQTNQSSQSIDQPTLDKLAASLDVKYRVLSNIETNCPDRDGKAVQHCFSGVINFTAPFTVNANDWAIFYSQVYPIYASESATLDIEFVNGDIHKIAPNRQFQGFRAGETQSIKVFMAATHLTHSQFMPNYWLAGEGLTPAVIASTRTTIDPDTRLEQTPWILEYDNVAKQIKSHPNDINQYASAKWLYAHNADTQLDSSQIAHTVIPTPTSLIVDDASARVDLSQGLNVTYAGLSADSVSAAFDRLQKLGVNQSVTGVPLTISVVPSGDSKDSESYQLIVTAEGITITAKAPAGAFYGVQSLASLLDVETQAFPLVTINDSPAYGYRGQHIDVARNFHDKAFMLRLIEQMAAYKMNRLHLHLAEDEAWRIELPSLPELTAIGSKRCMDLADSHCMQPQLGGADTSERDGYYSSQDYIEILQYASRHHIEVIPSLDMPGHSRAAVKAMEARYQHYMAKEDQTKATQYLLTDFNDATVYRSIQHYNDNTINVCMESAYAFVDRVLEDLIALHKKQTTP